MSHVAQMKTRRSASGLSLSPREFKLLRFLIDHRGEVLARERLLDAVWDYDNVPFTRTVDSVAAISRYGRPA